MADIGTAVAGFTAILESEFDIPVIDKDIEEDFPRPAFIIQTENITHDRIGLYPHDNFDLEIYYFSQNRYSGYADMYNIMKKIQELLSVDRVTFPDGYMIPTEEQDYELDRKDMTLKVTVNVDMVHPYTEPEGELMEVLNDRIKGYEKEG